MTDIDRLGGAPTTFAAPARELVPLSGFAHEPLAELADILPRVVAAQGGGGAALSVYRDGQPLVDLVAGEYRPDALQLVFSVSKAVSAVIALRLHHAGVLDLDAPLADVWPEFARATTRTITTRMVLAHTSGIPSVVVQHSLAELAAGAEEDSVARQDPFWEPGTRHGYHAFTFGTLLDGVVRRALGRTIGELTATELAAPLGLDLWIGLPESLLPRVQPVLRPRAATTQRATQGVDPALPLGQIGRLAASTDVYNDPLLMTAGFPAVGGVAGARDLARVFAAVIGPVDGIRLMDEPTLQAMVEPRSDGIDAVLAIPIRFGSGVQLPFPQLPMLGPTSFGHEGAGGSAVVVDRELGVSVGYTTSMFPPMMGSGVGFDTLLATIRHCLTR